MISATQPAKRRRWFRFSLRTLLIVVALAAVVSWGYWVAWPWWQAYREQKPFLEAAMKVKVGMLARDLPLPWMNYAYADFHHNANAPNELSVYPFDTAIYCIYIVHQPWTTGSIAECPIASVELFRLPLRMRERAADQYVRDFYTLISGDRSKNPGIQYELIYSDPPQNDKPH